LVLGNYEFYNISYEHGLRRARELEREHILAGKLTLLHRGRFEFSKNGEDLIVLGCTLWSHVPEDDMHFVRWFVTDFKRIKDWTVDRHNSVHEIDLAWLKDQVRQISLDSRLERKRILIVTHHAPSKKHTWQPQGPQPSRAEPALSSALATDLLKTSSWRNAGVKVWVYGHTHFTNDFRKRGIRVISNQRGPAWSAMNEPKLDGKEIAKIYNVHRSIQI
jgi:hypothetical protein